MSEEEKLALEIFKHCKLLEEKDKIVITYDDLKYYILNLIEEQQKEIKNLKVDRDYYKEMYYKIAFPEDEIKVYGLGVD